MSTDPIFLLAGGKQLSVFGRTGTVENVAVNAHTSLDVSHPTEHSRGSARSTTTLNTRFEFIDENGGQWQHSYPGGASVMRDGDHISLVYSGCGSSEAWSTIVNHDSRRIISVRGGHTFVYNTGAVWRIGGGCFMLSLLGFLGGPPLGLACIIGWAIAAVVQLWRAHSIWGQLSPVIDQLAEQLLSGASRPTADRAQMRSEQERSETPRKTENVGSDRSVRRGIALYGGSIIATAGLSIILKGEEFGPGIAAVCVGVASSSLYWLLEPASSRSAGRERPKTRRGCLVLGLFYMLAASTEYSESTADPAMIVPMAVMGLFHLSLFWILKR